MVIDIDDESIRRIGQWPWSRDQFARLVETASAARVIGIDLLLAERDRLGGRTDDTDALFAASLRLTPVVLAAAAESADESSPHPVLAATPVFEAGGDPRSGLPHYPVPSLGRMRRSPPQPPASVLSQCRPKPTGLYAECRLSRRSDHC